MTLKTIKALAKKHNWGLWTILGNLKGVPFITYEKKNVKLTVNFGDNPKVETRLYHPKSKGWTTLVRPDLTVERLEEVFANPRAHVGKGIYKELERTIEENKTY